MMILLRSICFNTNRQSAAENVIYITAFPGRFRLDGMPSGFPDVASGPDIRLL
jgi:hypothetical protein